MLQGKVTSPSLVYEGQQESLYFQGEPPEQFAVERDLARPPVSCLQDPIFPGQPWAPKPLFVPWSLPQVRL